MPNNITTIAQSTLGALPANLQQRMLAEQGRNANELGAGITSGFAVVSLRGKVWRIKHRGEERALTNERGEPRYSIEVVVVRAAEAIAKIFYENGYEEGSNTAPDCWSVDGRVPDPASPSLLKGLTGPTCPGCPMNAWGSARNANGGAGKGKACADSKRLAIVPAEDIDNEYFGGPMLMRVPPASLRAVKEYADKLDQMGYPVYAVATRISFDMNAEYPSLILSPIRVLTEDEAAGVLKWRDSDIVKRILDTPIERAEADVSGGAAPLQFEQAPAPRAVPQQARPTGGQQAPLRPVPTAPRPAPAPVVVAEPEVVEEAEIEEAEIVSEAPAPAPVTPKGNSFAPTGATAEPAAPAAPAKPKPAAAPKPKPVAAAPAPAPVPEPVADDAAGDGVVPEEFDSMLDSMLG